MKQIWKYELPLGDVVLLQMPDGASVIAVQPQRGVLTMWASVDPSAPLTTRTFRVIGTGNWFSSLDRLNYLGTAQCGALVWHVFEELL